MFSSIHIVSRALVVLAAAAAAVTATSPAPAASPPILVAPGGCALQCIQKAAVTTTPSVATVEIGTTVPAKVVVTARRLSSTGSPVAGPPDASVTGSLLLSSRTVFLRDLQPKTVYWIGVAATDASGHIAVRSGTFETQPAQTTMEPAVGGLSSNVGCSQKCITKAVPFAIGPTSAAFEIATSTPARITVIVSRNGQIASSVTSEYTTSFKHAAGFLYPGTTYDLFLRATDANGHTEHHHFTFKTVERHARVTLWRVKVINDGDKGSARGEMFFSYGIGGKPVGGEQGFHKRSSGDSFSVREEGTTRPGLTRLVPVNGPNPKLEVSAFAQECDGHTYMSNCAIEATLGQGPSGACGDDDDDCATARGAFGLSELLSRNALPASYGSSLPAGHDAYLVFETTEYYVKFRVYAFVDFVYA
jgi:hypothetical protein